MPSLNQLNGPLFTSGGQVITPSDSGETYDITLPSYVGFVFQAAYDGSNPMVFAKHPWYYSIKR